MTTLCPKCRQPIDPGRTNPKVCSSCGSALPLGIITRHLGLAILFREEAAAAERQRAGKSLNRRQRLIAALRNLDPQGAEFYTAAAGYLRKRFGPNRTYGLFFLFLGGAPLLLAISLPRWSVLEALLFTVGYLFFGALGLQLFYHSSATVRKLPKTQEGEDAGPRLRRLREVALNNRTDPIAALVLELTEGCQT